MKIKPTAFNVSFYFFILFLIRGYQNRGYFAFGGEWLLLMMGVVIHYILKYRKEIL